MLPPTSYDKAELPQCCFPIKGGLLWIPKPEWWSDLCSAYGNRFISWESSQAFLWLQSNPTRLKTSRGMPRFLNGWMARAAKEQAKRPQQVSVDKDWSDVPPEQLEAMRAKYEARGKG
jgi:hypothetical protein